MSVQRSETELQSENANYVSMFRQQTAATEEDLAIMKAQYAATQDLYEKRIRYLEGRIATLKQKSVPRHGRLGCGPEGTSGGARMLATAQLIPHPFVTRLTPRACSSLVVVTVLSR